MSFQSYIKIKGKKQGQFKGESKKKGREGTWMEFHSYKMGSSIPVDAASGLASGHRQHRPLVVTKERGASSPQCLQAHWNNEIIDEVVLEIVGRSPDGVKEIVVERITLTNANIVDINRYAAESSKASNTHDVDFVEDIQFRFQKIAVEDLLANTMAEDDWHTPGA